MTWPRASLIAGPSWRKTPLPRDREREEAGRVVGGKAGRNESRPYDRINHSRGAIHRARRCASGVRGRQRERLLGLVDDGPPNRLRRGGGRRWRVANVE